MQKFLLSLVFAMVVSLVTQSSVFAASCEERCDAAKDRCESHTSSVVGGFADGMNCVLVQQRCNQEENAKISRGGFPDHARCMQLGNDCTNQAGEKMKGKMEDTTEQCNQKYDACMNRCDR